MAAIKTFIGIGANLGDASETVRQAILKLADLPETSLLGQSSLFRTAPIDATGDDYINAVIHLETRLRTLDLDILLYGNLKIDTATLAIPHPRLTQRAFVLIPLLQIDPFITIPGKGAAHQFVPGVASQAIAKI